MYEIKILPNRRLTTPLFCTYALRSSLQCEIDTAVEPFREKNNNVKPTTYNVLLQYLAFVSKGYSLLSIMLKSFDVICQLADDFYAKSIFFHILVGFYPSKSVRAFPLLLLTICK